MNNPPVVGMVNCSLIWLANCWQLGRSVKPLPHWFDSSSQSMTMYFDSKMAVRRYLWKHRLEQFKKRFRRTECCGKTRNYWAHKKHLNTPDLFHLYRVPVEFFRIASLPTIAKDDLMYLRINPIESE
jgi:hypothetical protein